jgi:hypothetical protein
VGKGQIGRWVEVREDERGLFVVGQLNLQTEAGKEAFAHLQARDIGGLSIGFQVAKDGFQQHRAALLEWTRERVPLDWAMTQNNLGTALSILGERENQAHLLRNALEAVKGAAEIYRAAGMVQYDDYFADRISGLEAEMVAMDPTSLP